MRHGCSWLLAAALLPAALPRTAEADEGRSVPITIIGSPSMIPVGTRCRIELKPEVKDRETVETTYEGAVTEVTDEGIVLTLESERRAVTKKSFVADLPYLNRLYRNVGIGTPKPFEPRTVSIPTEKIRSVRCLDVADGSPRPGDVIGIDFELHESRLPDGRIVSGYAPKIVITNPADRDAPASKP